ncbi:MAG: carbamoyl phosphate synthase small subunit [Planctomycetota bacterium]|nr:MAG: carbamoyl phosphate synthase small subunit [Planctomycetota bacterium]
MNIIPANHDAFLVLEDGTSFSGKSFGANGEAYGEAVFNTSMMGYQEILTDPSYCGQLITMTYPLIGNYGVNDEDVESSKIQASGLIVREVSRITSNFRSTKDLPTYLKEQNIVAIEDIDTRALTRHLRSNGAMKAIISTVDSDIDSLLSKVKNSEGLVGIDLVQKVTCEKAYDWSTSGKFKVAVIDCGIKHNILRILAEKDCHLKVFPANTLIEEIDAFNPDGIFLSNGPGDPGAVEYVINLVKTLVERDNLPIFGICLGHQMLGLAQGADYSKLKFGHRGGNQPVKNILTSKVEITSQNHGFAIDADSLPPEMEVTHIHLNDNTLSGMRHKTKPIFSVQYHPEASPGPHDSHYLFDEFLSNLKAYQGDPA